MSLSYYFIAIGGIGMSALAHILLDKGFEVAGSDREKSAITETLEARGAKIFYGQQQAHVKPGDIVVYSTAMRESNPEMQAARLYAAEMKHRSELLEELLSEKKALVVTGAHGKTTTTGLLAHVLKVALDPSFVIGGIPPSLGRQGGDGKDDYFVAEGDESDGSFLRCRPYGAIITNIDDDHLDYWKTRERLHEGYKEFISHVGSKERLFFYAEDPFMRAWNVKGVSYGLSEDAEIRALQIRLFGDKSVFDLLYQGTLYTDMELALLGKHNVINSLGVIGMALSLGLSMEEVREGLKTFRGVKRRMEFLGEASGVRFFDDYAHHPEEIRATIEAVKQKTIEGRLIVVCQLHRYTRAHDLQKEFIEQLKEIDHLIVTDIYAAGEDPIEGITMQAFLEKMPGRGVYVPFNELSLFLADYVAPGDLVITLGAGNVTAVGLKVLELVQQR